MPFPYAGWTAASILVVVLIWFGRFYLPSRDKRETEHFAMLLAQLERKDTQMEKMLNLFLEESRTNRQFIKELLEKKQNRGEP